MEKRGLYTFLRYLVAFLILFYGFAKINGAQFTVTESVLDRPLGEVPGFWVVWHFFGYSAVYGNLIALVQVACGVLLLFRRTTLIASCVLLGMMVNIVLIDLFYGVPMAGTVPAVLITAAVGYLVWQHREELVRCFWTSQRVESRAAGGSDAAEAAGGSDAAEAPAGRSVRAPEPLGIVGRVLIVAIPIVFTWWVANFNNRRPTPLDGVWDVVAFAPADEPFEAPGRVYFERNRAFMAVFDYDGDLRQHHFLVDAERGALDVWERWGQQEGRLFEGGYELTGDTLVLAGAFQGVEEAELTLVRVR